MSTWPAIRLSNGRQGPWGVAIANTSHDPIYDVAVGRPRGVTQNGTNIDAISLTLKVLPPGVYFLDPKDKGDDMLTAVSPAGLKPIFRNIDYCAELTFRDSSSAMWRRLRNGQLSSAEATGAP
ncbi:hypothetical protein [Sinomonas sp. ASV322]|uniref:hypothetical protein n=1 Tax=Sinomonas sp. ASV322 TaxID=3041920 RepID=UPI0027DDD1DB|nr:hypothetical protein [Sinomonas sp. ASV322]MDQ4503062.1 hypothetical protein [Sinomonas sp. ASV322]